MPPNMHTGATLRQVQERTEILCVTIFGAKIAYDAIERNHRFLEEGLELVQSLGCSQNEAHQLVDYVYSRKTGNPFKECGGVMVTLAALCNAQAMSLEDCANVELERIGQPEMMDKIRKKQATKPKNSPLPEATETEKRIGEALG